MNTPTDAMQMSWVPHLSLMCGLMHAACMWCRDDNIRWTAPTLLARATNRRQRYFKSREEIRQKYAGKPPWNRFTKGSLNAYIEHAFKDTAGEHGAQVGACVEHHLERHSACSSGVATKMYSGRRRWHQHKAALHLLELYGASLASAILELPTT